MKPPFHLFMDLDGVILHGWHYNPALRIDWSKSIEEDIGFPRAHVQSIFVHPDYAMVASGKKDLKEHLSDVFEELRIQFDPDAFVSYWHQDDTKLENLNEDLLSMIYDLSQKGKIPVYLVTQQEKYRAKRIKDFLNLDRYFDKQFYSCDVGFLKNNPEFFRYVQRDLGIDPVKDKLIYFDDTPSYRTAAEQAGWDACDYQKISDFLGHSLIKKFISGQDTKHAPAV